MDRSERGYISSWGCRNDIASSGSKVYINNGILNDENVGSNRTVVRAKGRCSVQKRCKNLSIGTNEVQTL